MAISRADEDTRKRIARNPNLAVPLYLIHCYLYYVLDAAIVSDDTFNEVVSVLEAKWDTITHRHKGLLDREFLKSGFHLTYPAIVEHAARAYLGAYQ